MKTVRFLFATSMALALLVSGCVVVDPSIGVGPMDNQRAVVGSGHLVSVTLNFRNFSKIYLSHAFKARIERGSSYSVRVETDDNLEEFVRAYQSGDEIHIGLENNSYRNTTMNVYIQMPDVSLIDASGAATVSVGGFELWHPVELSASGASVFSGDLSATDVALRLSGSSAVNLAGWAESLTIEGSGGIVLHLLGFPVKTCKATLSGGSVSDVSVSDLLEISLSGGSVFRYKGNPVMRIVSLSGGSVIQKLY
jgi:hypothetical protein